MTVSSQTRPALDVVVEGICRKVADEATLQRVADVYAATMDWPMARGGCAVFGPSAPTAGPPPYAVIELAPEMVFGLPGIAGTEKAVGKAGSFTPIRWRIATSVRGQER